MVFAEADFLPGLVIDRFDDYFIVQITTAGMERFKEDIFSIVIEMYPSAVVVEKSISTSRLKEDLPEINRVRNPGRNSETVVSINGLKFRIDFLKSQKTGFFLDQRDNYLLLENISRGKDVLDAFSYAGAWGLHAYKFGARRVDFLEISAEYLDTTRENVRLNGFNPRHFDYIRDDALKRLKEMSKAGEKRDVIILDPPAFAKSRHKLRAAIRGYKEINLRALNMLIPGGFLITCSCSYFLTQPDFIQMVLDASADARRRIKLIDFRSQPYDHSILLPLYQSAYLKCGLFYVY
jgi:23S rRNA (cytosine1962-C5)-methyltransferase